MFFKLNDIATFKQYTEVAFTFDTGNVFNGLAKAEMNLVKPVLGNALFATLQTAAVAETVPEELVELLHYVRCIVAPASILITLPGRAWKITDSGISRFATQDQERIVGWEYREIEDKLSAEVAEAINNLWEYLYSSPEGFSWTDTNPNKSIFKTAKDFAQYYALHQPYRIFPLLVPIIYKVEKLFVDDAIGKAFLKELKELETPEGEELEAIELLKSAIAHFTIHKSTSDLPAKITPQGFTVLLKDATDRPYKGELNAPDNTLSLVRNETLNDGRKFMGKLKNFLNSKASAELFETYFSSTYYTSPNTAKVDRNATRKIVRL